MTHQDLNDLLKFPQTVKASHIPDLKDLVERFPYFSEAKILLAKAMLVSGNLNTTHYINRAALSVSDRRHLYFYLYPEKKDSKGVTALERKPRFEGTYFDMVNVVESEGGNSHESFKNLANRLREARQNLQVKTENSELTLPRKTILLPQLNQEYFEMPAEPIKTSPLKGLEIHMPEISESEAKRMIQQKRYEEAIQILNKLNLNNPKKSIYFADQIRFLERILQNAKKI